MRFPILLGTFLWGLAAQAGVMPLFSHDGKTATLLLMGQPGDADPAGLYHALKMEPVDFQGKWSKRLAVAAPDGGKAFDIACVFSKAIPNSGTCTVILRKVPGMIDVGGGRTRMWLSGAAAAQLADAFIPQSEDGTILFRSQDGRLNITTARDGGKVLDLVVDWR